MMDFLYKKRRKPPSKRTKSNRINACLSSIFCSRLCFGSLQQEERLQREDRGELDGGGLLLLRGTRCRVPRTSWRRRTRRAGSAWPIPGWTFPERCGGGCLGGFQGSLAWRAYGRTGPLFPHTHTHTHKVLFREQ